MFFRWNCLDEILAIVRLAEIAPCPIKPRKRKKERERMREKTNKKQKSFFPL
jgi:hypothetical protein